MPRTVVVVNDFGSVNGGTAKVAIESACGLADRGYQVVFFCAVGPLDKSLAEHGVRVVCLDQQASLNNPSALSGAIENLWNDRAARELRILLRSSPKDTLVHIHGWTKALSASVLHEIQHSGMGTVLTLHDYFIACPNGGFFQYPTKQICTLKPMSLACITNNCDKVSYGRKLFRIVRQAIQNQNNGALLGNWRLVAISKFSLEKLRPYIAENAQVTIIPGPNEFNLSKEQPADPGINTSFLGVGRMDPEKGMDLFARAAADIGVHATFAGDGDSRAQLQELCPAGNFLGWVNHSEVVEQMRRARALVFPSRWPETQGLVVWEAAALGIPSIVSDNSGASEFVVDGVTGFHFPTGDVEALKDRLNALRDGNLAARMGKAAYDLYWSDPHTLSRHLNLLESVYRTV